MNTAEPIPTAEPAPTGGSGRMFDQIAARYDLLNRIISFGLDRRWRRRLVDALAVEGVAPCRVLDVATGTADVALTVARHYPDARITGLDPSREMLAIGQEKIARAELAARVELDVGDAQSLPYPDDHFDAACVSFGIRNVPDRDRGLSEMRRVTRAGGVVAVLELGEPREGLLAPFARLHVHHVVPRIGAWLSGAREYRYLQSSVAAFPPPDAFASQMTAAGLVDVGWTPLAFGAAHLYRGRVPD